MIFHGWAPSCLVDELRRQEAKTDRYKQMLSDTGGMHIDDHSRMIWEEAVEESSQLAEILLRLLTNIDMKAAWTALCKPAINPRNDQHREYLLWDCIKQAFDDYRLLAKSAQTPAEKRNTMRSIDAKVKALQRALVDNLIAHSFSCHIVQTHLSMEFVERQLEAGQAISAAEAVMPSLALLGDLHEAQVKDSDDEVNVLWSDRQLVDRLSFWASKASETSLYDLLSLLSDFLEAESKSPPEIKQPGRGYSAIKPFLIRRVSAFTNWCFGQPLDDVVAIIVSVALNLETPLTRDDVRPYVSKPGKN